MASAIIVKHVLDISADPTPGRLDGGSFKRVCVQLSPPLRFAAPTHPPRLTTSPYRLACILPRNGTHSATGVREIGVIERFAAVVSALDGGLEPREGDEFLAWLRSQGFDAPPTPPQGSPPTEEDETAARAKVEKHGNNGQSDGGGAAAEERAEVEAFLSAASARLNALVANKEDALFGDRGEQEESVQAKGERRGEGGAAAAAGGDASGEPVVSPNMSDEELYQVRERERAGRWEHLDCGPIDGVFVSLLVCEALNTYAVNVPAWMVV